MAATGIAILYEDINNSQQLRTINYPEGKSSAELGTIAQTLVPQIDLVTGLQVAGVFLFSELAIVAPLKAAPEPGANLKDVGINVLGENTDSGVKSLQYIPTVTEANLGINNVVTPTTALVTLSTQLCGAGIDQGDGTLVPSATPQGLPMNLFRGYGVPRRFNR